MHSILALDQGTTSCRAILFDAHGIPRATAQRELTQHFPQPGWVEHDPHEIWESQLEVAREALALGAVIAPDVAAIGITNQRETTMLWERHTGRPIGRAIVWQDRRTAQRCDELRAGGVGALVARKTGLVLDPYFSATKIGWLLDHYDLRDRAERGELAFGTIDTWLLWNLTGGAVHATDHTNASRTLLFDLRGFDWDDELCAAFDVPRALLPAIHPSISRFGATVPDYFGDAIPIAGIAGDQQAALFGQAGFARGIAKNTYGTGSFVVLNTGDDIVASTHGLLATVACSSPGTRAYALEGSVFAAGAAVQWLRDGLGIIATANDIEALASSVPSAEGVTFVPAFSGLGAPYWDAHARGLIAGITRGSTRAHIARAALEAIAYQSADVIEAMLADARLELHELRVDGGASKNDILMQFQADVLGVDVMRPAVIETTALGVAYMAGLQCGVWSDMKALEKLYRVAARFSPRADAATRNEAMAGWRRAVARARS
jgi:glycerol kinase